ncbi:MAG: 16S rRNA (cytosine(1402)-N(4))-methyltransferase RsmH, partial [Candidatus Woesearchaeota archaeon]
MKFEHKPIMLDKVIKGLNIKQDGIYVDCTIGGAGHSKEIFKRLSKDGLLIGIDRDIEAIDKSKDVLKDKGDNFLLINDNFKNIQNILDINKIEKVDGILLDLGVSSYQIDNPERGFSYIQDVELDMRMDKKQDFNAKDLLNTYTEEQLKELFFKYGEEKFSSSIAKNIVKERQKNKIITSSQLNNIIDNSIPKKVLYKKGHSSKKIFQAIRIEVNQELKDLEKAILNCIDRLKKGGRIAIISFHSLEDRLVKHLYRNLEKDCVCPPDFPICTCDKVQEIKIVTKKPLV